MAYTYLAGEKKVRPGVYQRISKRGTDNVVSALNGVVAFAMTASWGPVDKVVKCENAKSVRETFGTGASVEAACSIFEAGASVVYIKRLEGENGTAGTIGTAAIGSVVNLNALYPSGRTLDVTVKLKAGDATKKQIVIKEGTTILENLEFAANETDETESFMNAVKLSAYITAEKLAAGVITTGDYTLTGTDPVVTAADYADAFYALEPYNYNVLVTDSIETGVFSTLCAYAEESYENGKLIMVVGGADPTTSLADRMANAAACNSARIVYFGGSWTDIDGNEIKGAAAMAYIAGIIAATPANRSVVHKVISKATDVPEKLTNSQYIEAIKNGLLMVSVGPDRQVWIDSGINTLINPTDEQDEGWKKIRRVRTRYELMDRIDRTLAPKIGNINCDADGIAYIIQSATGVIKEMIAEKKISAGTFYEDPENPYEGDSAWFIIEADDIDSLEKIYLHYQFRYVAN